LCTRWIKQAKYDPLVLLTHLNPSIYEQECETVIKTLLKVANDATDASSGFIKDLSDAEIGAFRQGMNNSKVLNNDNAWKPETLLLARLQCDQSKLSPAKKADLLSKVVPDIPLLCDAIQSCMDTLANLAVADDEASNQEQQEEAQIFICNQLFKLAQLMDLQEEGSRRHFCAACKAMLTSIHTPEELLEEAIKAMSRAHDREDDYLSSISDIVDQMSVADDYHESEDETQRLVQLRVVSILTIVLENTSPRMALHPALKSFVHHVVPAVTNDDVLIREAGVGCLGRLALLSEESTVLAEFKPLFLEVVNKEDETMEIRAQAMLALCDLAMLFDNILVPIDAGASDLSFVDVVSTMLQNENPSVVAVASEVATKLLFSGKVQDKDLLASLLVVFFNKTYDDYEEDDDVQEVGSVFRMQQLLSLFFQAYSMKSQDCKSTLVRAIRPMLELVATKSKKRKGKGTWPISKMIEFVYSTAEIGTEGEQKEGEAQTSTSTSALLVCIEISSFLVQHNDNLTNTNLRTLCKLLGGADVDVEATNDTRSSLLDLKEKVNELGMLITDEASLESLETMMELLEEVEEKDEEENDLVDAMENVALDKENETSFVSARKAEEEVGEEHVSERPALATVN
jgi:condensin complex subunit 3